MLDSRYYAQLTVFITRVLKDLFHRVYFSVLLILGLKCDKLSYQVYFPECTLTDQFYFLVVILLRINESPTYAMRRPFFLTLRETDSYFSIRIQIRQKKLYYNL